MLAIVEKFLRSEPKNIQAGPVQFIKVKRSMLKALKHARESGIAVGLNSGILGEGMFLVGVERVDSSGAEEVIILKPYDMSGHLLIRPYLTLDEIKWVSPLSFPYKNPLT